MLAGKGPSQFNITAVSLLVIKNESSVRFGSGSDGLLCNKINYAFLGTLTLSQSHTVSAHHRKHLLITSFQSSFAVWNVVI